MLRWQGVSIAVYYQFFDPSLGPDCYKAAVTMIHEVWTAVIEQIRSCVLTICLIPKDIILRTARDYRPLENRSAQSSIQHAVYTTAKLHAKCRGGKLKPSDPTERFET